MGCLLDVPGVRREGSAAAAKVLQAAMPLLGVDPCPLDPGVEDGLLALLGTLLRSLPTSYRPHGKAAEAALVRRLMAHGTRDSTRAMAARLLGMLPLAQGDEEAWSDHARRLIATVHELLGSAYPGRDLDPSLKEACANLLASPDGKAASDVALG